jgi:DNA polymerase III alpha subunit (gram-positive type)
VLADNEIGGSRVDLSRLIVTRDDVIHTLTDLSLSDSAFQVQENVRKMVMKIWSSTRTPSCSKLCFAGFPTFS